MSEWYEGLTVDDFPGKHLQVCMINGVVYAGLVLADDVLVAMDLCGESRPILERESAASEWRKSPGVESVALVWDECDWEELGPDEYGRADAIVVNGRLIRVNGLAAHHQFRPVVGFSVSSEHVSCALRCRHKLPTELGAYRGADGTLMMLTDIGLPDKWVYVSEDFKECGVFLGDEQAEEHLPLTPVHFVDGRAE